MAKKNSDNKKKGKSKGIKVDFTGVEASKRLADGSYLGTVEAVTVETSDNSGEDYLKFVVNVNGSKLFHNTSLQPQALWKLRNTLEAMGMEVPDKAMNIDTDELEGQEIGVIVENETYQGKRRPRIVDVIPVSDVEENEEEEEEEEEERSSKKKSSKKEEKKSSKKSSKKEEEEEEENEEEEEEEEEEQEEEEEERPSKKSSAKKKPAKKSKDSGGKIKKGSDVTFEDDGEEYSGTVKSIDGDTATVDVDGDEWEIELSDLTLV